MPALVLFNVERVRLPHQITQLSEAVGSCVEVRGQIGELRASGPEWHPALLAFHL